MRKNTLLVSSLLVLCANMSPAQAKWALLIGINTYQPSNTSAVHADGCSGGRCDLPQFPNLNGPVNDVEAMRDFLTSPRVHFEPANVIVLTNPKLPDSKLPYLVLNADQTTHDGILAAMRKYLVDTPKSGDTVVFYYAGHGSLRLNHKGTKLRVLVDGNMVPVDSTIVPSDAWTGAFDVRDREMTRIFDDALDKGIKLTVLLDSCHSGALTRGVTLGPKQVERVLPYDPRALDEGPDLLPDGKPRPAPAEHPKNPALIFSAAQQDQTAKESAPSSSSPASHGAFTVALIHAMESLPVDAPASVVYEQVLAEMQGTVDQTPSLDAGMNRRNEPLFGGESSKDGKLRAAAVGVDGNGQIVLDSGKLAGVGPGSTFVRIDSQGRKVILKVKDLDGIARSRAAVLSPPGAQVDAGQVFELEKWAPPPLDPLKVWTWPATLTQADVASAAEQVKAAGVDSVEDPANQAWTDLLSWDGTSWVVQHAGSSASTSLGEKLTVDTIRKHLHSGSKVWVNLPPPKELSQQLDLSSPAKTVQVTQDIGSAEYVLAGALTSDGPSWTWFRRIEFQKGPVSGPGSHQSPGCSATSTYPVRTDWVLLADSSVLPDAAKVLNKSVLQLAKLQGWMNLPSSPGSSADYYRLAFARKSDGSLISRDQVVHKGDVVKPMLVASDRVYDKRWVYILDIDCHGKGVLLYPRDYTENRFPNDGNNGLHIELPGAPDIEVQEPFGLDSIFLISTSEPLPNPWALEFDPVTTRGAGPARIEQTPNPLQDLLGNASSGTRGLTPVMPTSWSVTTTGIQSVETKP